jgi:hypothetical protein
LLSQKNSCVVKEIAALVSLVLIELLCFLPIMRSVGFYFDDWATLSQLYFGPKDQGLWALVQNYGYNNSLVIIRPIEALHFGLAFYFFGLNPFPWHLVNVILEIVVAILTCVIVRKLSGSLVVGFFAAVFVMLCPSHDSSHYWIVCSSVTLSFALYLASLLATIEALGTSKVLMRVSLHSCSALFFALSLFNYETFMPLAVLNIFVSILVHLNRSISLTALFLALRKSVPSVLAMVLPVVSLLFYLKVVVPSISSVPMRAINFDMTVFLTTIFNGVCLSSPMSLAAFVFERAREGLSAVSTGELLRAALLTLLVGGVIFLLTSSAKDSKQSAPDTSKSLLSAYQLILLGLIAVVVSYSIFGLSPDYPPTYLTYLNRINTGSSFGLALAFTGIFMLCFGRIKGRESLSIWPVVALSIPPMLLFLVFTLANFGLAKPWIASWVTQKHIHNKIVQNAKKLAPNSSLLLLNCPRYVMWAPVYDGIWDFRNTVRILLHDRDFSAGVVSERLVLSKNKLEDISRGVVCGVYPFSSLYLLVAPDCNPIRVENPKQFVEVVESRGMDFGLEQSAVRRWKERVADLEQAK